MPVASDSVLTVTELLKLAECAVCMLTVALPVVYGLQARVVGLATLSSPLLPKFMLHVAPAGIDDQAVMSIKQYRQQSVTSKEMFLVYDG